MSEAAMWKKLRNKLSSLSAIEMSRVENGVAPGLPDVIYSAEAYLTDTHVCGTGLLELKYLANWPVRAETIVRVTLRDAQRFELFRHGEINGGRSWVLVQIEKDWLLFDHKHLAHFNHSNTRTFIANAAVMYCGVLNTDNLVRRLAAGTEILERRGFAGLTP